MPADSPASAAPFTVRLQQLAAASESATHLEQNTAPLEPNALRSPLSRAPVTMLVDDDLISGKQNRSRAAASVEDDEASGLVLPPPPPADTYYTAHDLDVYPTLRDALKLQYPDAAGRARVSGRALVMLALNEAGVLDDVSIVQSDPPGYFEDAVRATLGVARFFPAQKNGRAVKSRILINVEFEPD